MAEEPQSAGSLSGVVSNEGKSESPTPSPSRKSRPVKRVSYHASVEEHQRNLGADRSEDEDTDRVGISRVPSIGRDQPYLPTSFSERRRSHQKLERGVYKSETAIPASKAELDPLRSHTDSELPSRRRTIAQMVDFSFTLSVRRLTSTVVQRDADELQRRNSEEHFVTAVLHDDLSAPAVELSYPFSYPMTELPVTRTTTGSLSMDAFEDCTYISSGSNAEVFKAKLCGSEVCLKVVREDQDQNEVAKLEFEFECGILSRISHPNILSLYGHGVHPRRFLVLEFLTGGTLKDRLMERRPYTITNLFYKKPLFNLPEVYHMFIQLCDALDYLHRRLHSEACIIHRDLKPDNIGFLSNGKIILFDFGLSICVRKFTNENTTYAMSGRTGSLRYMAPEVALEQPYNEKVDIYSCGILMWQVAADELPFIGAKAKDFMKFVVVDGYRPKLRKYWPQKFKDLLKTMWDADASRRPTAQSILDTLQHLRGGGSVAAAV